MTKRKPEITAPRKPKTTGTRKPKITVSMIIKGRSYTGTGSINDIVLYVLDRSLKYEARGHLAPDSLISANRG